MKLNYREIGEFIQLVDNKNKLNKFTVDDLRGVNINKEFMPSVANTTNLDLSKYKIVKYNQFACNLMHVMRDERLPIALNKEKKPIIVSPAYSVFEIKDTDVVLPEYLLINFLRPENDRLAWFKCDSSVRGGLEWERLCEIKIPIIPISEQKRIVKLYTSLKLNKEYVHSSLNDLKIITESYIDGIKKTKPYVKIGSYIEQSDLRNRDLPEPLEVDAVKGISNNKVFIETKANMSNVNLGGYKVVEKDSFAFVTVTSRNGNKISIALNNGSEKLVSSTYVVFKVINKQKLLPEFLYLWFNRAEFDRYSRYHSLGSAREVFNWEDMCDVEIPLPSIEEQQAIIKIHHILEGRMKLVEELERQIKDLAPILMRGVVEEMKQLNY
ncbi:restriction endonuclease subunit S [Oceanobacillus caeni]|uniref:restriction endonuclease subunit S n=1 Tax=Oceanobacillus caeni TaxID=405946 RepID=UPI002E2491DC|nr:restriction endonuclease subunit S [Oceanobacillus caeni]